MTSDRNAIITAYVCAVAIVAIAIGVVLNDSPAQNARNRQVEEAPPLAETISGDGVFIVGKHVKRGTYRTAGGPRCTWARLTDLTGEPASILDRGPAPGRQEVDLVKGVIGFETRGCPEWVMVR